MRSEGVGKAERYSSGGVVSGVVGLAVAVAILGFAVFDSGSDFPAWGYPLTVLAAVGVWAVLIRPAVVLHEAELELRNVFHSRWVPYARITSVVVGQVTTIRVDEAKYVGSGFGRSRLAINRDAKATQAGLTDKHSLGWLVEEKLQRRAKAAVREGEPAGEVRRTWAVPEIAALAVLAAVTLVLLAVG